ncbi:hypothetical protein PMIN05_007859 [Paraphaeosphaeria minitans]
MALIILDPYIVVLRSTAAAPLIAPSNITRPLIAPNLYVPDTEAGGDIIFSTFGTLLTIVGIFVAIATLRIAHRACQAKRHQGSNNTGTEEQEMEMDTVDDASAPCRVATVDRAIGPDE